LATERTRFVNNSGRAAFPVFHVPGNQWLRRRVLLVE